MFSVLPSGGGEGVGLHSASDRRGNPDEEEKEEHCYPEASGQSSPHTAEEPIKRLSAGQDFQLQQIRVTAAGSDFCTHLNEVVSVMSEVSSPTPGFHPIAAWRSALDKAVGAFRDSFWNSALSVFWARQEPH